MNANVENTDQDSRSKPTAMKGNEIPLGGGFQCNNVCGAVGGTEQGLFDIDTDFFHAGLHVPSERSTISVTLFQLGGVRPLSSVDPNVAGAVTNDAAAVLMSGGLLCSDMLSGPAGLWATGIANPEGSLGSS